MRKLGLQGADLLPASLLCSQGNEKLAGVNHRAALRSTVTVCFPVQAARAGPGLVACTHRHWRQPPALGSRAIIALLQAEVMKFRENRRELQEQTPFLNCTLLPLLYCSRRLAPTLQVNCSRDPEGTGFLFPSLKLLLQTTFHPWRFICNYYGGELQ